MLAQALSPASDAIPLVLDNTTAEADFTTSMAWGDFDNDGDLDLVVGNGMIIKDDVKKALDRLALTNPLLVIAARVLGIDRLIEGLTVYDNRHNRLYCNEGGVLVSCWEFPGENDFTTDVAWGDMDNDGDLDLAVADTGLGVRFAGNDIELYHETPNRIYRNNGRGADGAPNFELLCCSDLGSSVGIAWGDYDGDGDLDLAVANSKHFMKVDLADPNNPEHDVQPMANQIYRNHWIPDGVAEFTLDPSFTPPPSVSFRVAWVDVDQDGRLDLTFANQGTDQVYCNRPTGAGQPLKLCWQSPPPSDLTTGMSWGDVDNDGDLDLAVGNAELWGGGQPSRLYRNNGVDAQGQLRLTQVWTSTIAGDASLSVAWGDVNNDGLLDLAMGNGNFAANQPNRIYCGNGNTLGAKPCWSSPDNDITTSVAWGDFDSDGDLDLATGNISTPVGQNNRLYRNDAVPLSIHFESWAQPGLDSARALALGDADLDGDLDLMVGNGGPPDRANQLYLNTNGTFTERNVLTFAHLDNTRAIAWGDADQDGDLDLLVGNARESQIAGTGTPQPSFLYCNRIVETGSLTFAPVWTVPMQSDVAAVAWGDIDGDGDLDLAVGNSGRTFDLPVGQPNQIYRNDGVDCRTEQAVFTKVWQSAEADATQSVAWGDVDNDGDLDLAVGNSAGGSHLYRNDGVDTQNLDPNNLHRFTLTWTPVYTDDTHSVAWGDMNGDGLLDLALGNTTQSNRVYCNHNGVLAQVECWRSVEAERTRAVAWGDVDGDGDLDLAVGNQEAPNQLYLNLGGMLTNSAAWTAADSRHTWGLDWGDVDNDGDLDLAAGNLGSFRPGLYRNQRRRPGSFTDLLPSVVITRPGATAAANGFVSPYIIRDTAVISVEYKLFGVGVASVAQIFPEYSLNGGGQWFPAMPAAGGDGLTGLAASAWPTGTTHLFRWQVAQDLIKNDNVVLRMRVQPQEQSRVTALPPTGSQSLPFRFEAPWYLHVVDENAQPVAAAALYAAGQFITTTNRAGLVGAMQVTATSDIPVVALLPQATLPSTRPAHLDNVAYTIHTTSLTRNAQGEPIPFLTTASGEQRLTLHRQEPLVLFNLVVSLEWPATVTETTQIATGIYSGSNYLYDLTDGQMALGYVEIVDSKRWWDAADIQFATANIVRPHARINGLRIGGAGTAIQLGRAWDGNQGDSGPWDEPNGYRTIIHEFGHYALRLYDEYLIPVFAPGNPQEVIDMISSGKCVRTADRTAASGSPLWASAMYNQYVTSELSDQGLPGLLWSSRCAQTAQWLLAKDDRGNPLSAWDALVYYYGDREKDPPRWEIISPSHRTPKRVIEGPTELPPGLPRWPTITVSFSERIGPQHRLTVVDGANRPLVGVTVALLKANGYTRLEQGVTAASGQIALIGAEAGDRVEAHYVKDNLFGAAVITATPALTVTVTPVRP
ncbi:MAG: VCBS repeat-containing protein [Caldilineaceae bacterium]